jgi:hypothetical protein
MLLDAIAFGDVYVVDCRTELQNRVDRAFDLAGKIGGYVSYGQQVLVIDAFVYSCLLRMNKIPNEIV